MPMKKPPHPGHLIKVIEADGLSVTEGARVLA
jgi:hypothetical protein